MRAYLPITPQGLQSFLATGSFRGTTVLIVDRASSADDGSSADDLEELEFDVSWEASAHSRELQADPKAKGFVLALDLEEEHLGDAQGNQAQLLSEISWSQVQSLLVSESEEPELSWYAPQEISTYLPQWLA